MSGAGRTTGLPDFLVIGAMRAGTTSIYRYLSAHPEVFLVPKELQFFTVHFDEGLDWYRNRFRPAGDRAAGEATADYFARASAMDRIAATLPEARLIVSLRNPSERAWSHYWLLRSRGRESRSFEAVFEQEAAALSAGSPPAGVIYLPHSRYDEHLERLFRLFAPSQVHISIFERMVAEPEPFYRSVTRFLHVDPSFVPENLGDPVNAFVGFRSLRLRRLTQRLPQPAARVVGRFNSLRGAPRPTMEDATRRRLDRYFAPHVRRVEELLGYEVPEWRPPSADSAGQAP